MAANSLRPDSGRVRVDEISANWLLDVLNEKRHRLVILRADAKASGQGTWDFQRELHTLDRLKDELERTMAEKRWLP
jgi:hypothetical protein